MRLTATALVSATLLAIVLPALPVRAQDPAPTSFASRTTLSAALGYAYPVGESERGNDTRDVSFGLVPLSLLGGYDLGKNWSAQLRMDYALNIPTLCASSSDCVASVGHDARLQIGIARTLPQWRSFTAQLALYLGWEWLSTNLTDSGVTATRSWNGPSAAFEIFVDLRSHGPWSFGPVLGLAAGIFTHYDLETPAWRSSGATDTSIHPLACHPLACHSHAWPSLAFRVGRRL
jgi:hypothetical protein